MQAQPSSTQLSPQLVSWGLGSVASQAHVGFGSGQALCVGKLGNEVREGLPFSGVRGSLCR